MQGNFEGTKEMKYFWIVCAFFLMEGANAQTITVGNVKVSVTADSAASAREKAIGQAHQLACQKLVNENFPERAGSFPSQDVLMDMVNDFSIDREKTTSTSYAASLTFQFDESQVLRWVQQDGPLSPTLPPMHQTSESRPLKIKASYRNHAEWQYIRKTLENFPGVQNLSIFTLSAKNASMRISYLNPIDRLEKGLLQKGILLSQQEDGWVVSSNGQMLH